MLATIETRTTTFPTREHSRLERRGYDYATITYDVVAYDGGMTCEVRATVIADGLAATRPLTSRGVAGTYNVTGADLRNNYKGLWAWVEDVIKDTTANYRRVLNK